MRLPPAVLGLGLTVLLVGCSGSGSAPPGDRATGSSAGPSAATSPTAAPGPARAPRLTARRAGWRLPAARSRAVVVATTNGLVVTGGLSSADVSTDTVWLLRPTDGRVTATGRLATAVHDATGFALGTATYVAGGGSASTVAAVQRLAPGATATVVGHLPQPRSDLSSVAVGGAAYVLGGFDGVHAIAAVLRTTDGRTFSPVARLPVTVRYAAVVALGDQLLVFGGEHDGAQVTDVQAVDLRAHRASVVGHLPVPLSHEAAFVLDGDVWLAGGRSAAVTQRGIWRWDPSRGRLHRAGTLPYAVADAGVAVVAGSAYLVGGEAPSPLSSVVVMRPVRRRG
jgi:hypothetical protein